MNSPENVGTWAEWFGAAATLLAVLVALFGSEIRSWWHHPKIRAVAKAEPPDCHKTFLQNQVPTFGVGPLDCYYLRLSIVNDGPVRAEGVQVYVSKLLRQTAGGAFREVPGFLPMNLIWSHGVGSPSQETWIAPKMGKHCDLAVIKDPARSAHPVCRLELAVQFPPNKGTHVLDPDTYRLHLRIAGSNFKPVEAGVQVSCAGNWYPNETDMLEKGVSLRLVSKDEE
jgi:hypothetical protein